MTPLVSVAVGVHYFILFFETNGMLSYFIIAKKATKTSKHREAQMPKVRTMELDSLKEAENIPKHNNPTNTA